MSTLVFERWEDSNGVPHGTCIQFKHYRYVATSDLYVQVNGASATYDTPVSISFTPKYANSLIYVMAMMHTRRGYYAPDGQYGVHLIVTKDGTPLPTNVQGNHDFAYSGELINHHDTLRADLTFIAGQTTAMTLRCRYRNHSQSGQGEWCGAFGGNHITVMEIQQ